jgi:hypothetical protein
MLARGTASGMRAKQGRIENFNSLSETIGSRAVWESTALCGLVLRHRRRAPPKRQPGRARGTDAPAAPQASVLPGRPAGQPVQSAEGSPVLPGLGASNPVSVEHAPSDGCLRARPRLSQGKSSPSVRTAVAACLGLSASGAIRAVGYERAYIQKSRIQASCGDQFAAS